MSKHKSNISSLIISLIFLAIISVILSLFFGSAHIGFAELMRAFTHPSSNTTHTIIFNLRLPRTICAFITGGLLALAGALMQTLLRNPLADPYVLGISGGAAVASLLGLLLGFSMFIGLFAFIGSLFAMFLVLTLSRTKHHFSSFRLLLTGVVIATGFSAIISFILTISPAQNLRSMLFWLMGDMSYAHFAIWQPVVLIVGTVIALFFAKPLNILIRGDLAARSLGINTHRLNLWLYIVSSLLTACAVSIAGSIGFIGLIVPHMLRLLGNSDHRFIIPASVLLGGTLLTLADMFARTIIAPIQLPVGIVTAIIGVPLFLFLLHRGSK